MAKKENKGAGMPIRVGFMKIADDERVLESIL